MTLGALVALALLELEDQLLLALVLVDDLCRDLDLGGFGCVGNNLVAIVEEKDLQVDPVASLALDLLDVEHVARLNGVLLATGFHNCVHFSLPFDSILARLAVIQTQNKSVYVKPQPRRRETGTSSQETNIDSLQGLSRSFKGKSPEISVPRPLNDEAPRCQVWERRVRVRATSCGAASMPSSAASMNLSGRSAPSLS